DRPAADIPVAAVALLAAVAREVPAAALPVVEVLAEVPAVALQAAALPATVVPASAGGLQAASLRSSKAGNRVVRPAARTEPRTPATTEVHPSCPRHARERFATTMP